MEHDRQPKICVVGGGFGGVNTALTLSSLPWPSDRKPAVILLDKKERFVFLPLLYELCVDDASVEEVAPTYRSLLAGSDVTFEQCEVSGVDVENNMIYTTSTADNGLKGRMKPLEYDALVIATGAEVNIQNIPGAAEFALPFYTVEECFELRRRFNLLDAILESDSERSLNVVVVGGGYCGVELSLNALQRLGGRVSVTLVHRGEEVLQYATEYNRKTGQNRLNDAGINIMTDTSVTEVVSNQIDGESNKYRCKVKVADKVSGSETELDADLLLWSAGAQPSNNNRGVLNSLLPRDVNGRIVTGPYLRAKGLPNVFAIGDCSRAKKVPYPSTAQVAIQQAPVAAWNVYASLRNTLLKSSSDDDTKLLPFKFTELGEMMTLGSDDATISGLGGLFQLSGQGASVLRRLVYAVRMPTLQQGVSAALESTERRLQVQKSKKTKKVGGKVIDWR